MCHSCSVSKLSAKVFRKICLRNTNSYHLSASFQTSEHIQKNDKGISHNFSERVFSGIQPTGIPHLGNYVGAIRNWVRLQKQYDSMLLSVVDLHSITIPQDPKELRENIFKMTACLLASGIDPKKCILFQQSMVPHHCELSWIFSCLCTVPRLQGMQQWKEKSVKVKDPSVGLLTYPILQSADILLYKGTHVPVGEDQLHHVELTRDLAQAFNRNFGTVFPKPAVILDSGCRIKSLKDPTSKMSKSDLNDLSRIDLTDGPDIIHKKIKKAVTDNTSSISYDPENRPGVANLINIHSSLADIPTNDIVEQSAGLNKVEYKQKVADIINDEIQPISKEITKLLGDKYYLQTVLRMGADKAIEIAEKTMNEVKPKVGIS